MGDFNIDSAARIFQLLSDPTRLAILRDLRGGELCACEVLENLKISQPTLSHHLSLLVDSGFVAARKEGKWRHYSLMPQALHGICSLAEEILKASQPEKERAHRAACAKKECSS